MGSDLSSNLSLSRDEERKERVGGENPPSDPPLCTQTLVHKVPIDSLIRRSTTDTFSPRLDIKSEHTRTRCARLGQVQVKKRQRSVQSGLLRLTASNRRALWRRGGIRWHHARGSLGAQGRYAVLPSSKNNNSILSIHLPIQGFYSLLYDVRTLQLGDADINYCVYLFWEVGKNKVQLLSYCASVVKLFPSFSFI